MPVRQRLKRWLRRDRNLLGGSSGASTPGQSTSTSVNVDASNSTPPPIIRTPDIAPEPANDLPSPSFMATNLQTDGPQPAITIAVRPLAAELSTAISTGPNPTTNPATPSTTPAMFAPPSTVQKVQQTAWSGLKVFLGLLSESADGFEPLKSAVGGINRCIEIYEVRLDVDLS
jgi:hypothetical protein